MGNGIGRGSVAVSVGDGGVGIECAAGGGAGFAAITEVDSGADVGLPVVWVVNLDLDRRGERGGDCGCLGAASGDGDDVKQSVGFETIFGPDINLAVGHGLRHKMANRRQLVAPIGGLIRRIEQLERHRVKGEQLTGDSPQNSVAVAIGGNGRGVTAAVIAPARFQRSAEQPPGQRKSHERRGIGGEVHGVIPVGGRPELDVAGAVRLVPLSSI